MASRESLIENSLNECESDDAVLMSQVCSIDIFIVTLQHNGERNVLISYHLISQFYIIIIRFHDTMSYDVY